MSTSPSPATPASKPLFAVLCAALLAACLTGGCQSGHPRIGAAEDEAAFEREQAGGGSHELWFIGRPPGSAAGLVDPQSDAPDELAGVPPSGGLVTEDVSGEVYVPVPLEHTDVEARLFAGVASVTVAQRFTNPFESKIEAVYVFPLPADAAVSEFLMKIGERTIRGIIRERDEAEYLYEQARAGGYVASLMTQERPNVFTQKVANIEPGKAIDVEVEYFHDLPYVDGWYELVYPMVVGPRYNPADASREHGALGDGVGAVPRHMPGASGQATEVAYLAPGERSGHDIDVAVHVDAGVAIRELRSTTHEIEVEQPSPEKAHVRLAAGDRIPNKDFVLRYRVDDEAPVGACLARRDGADGEEGHFTLTVYPPNLPAAQRMPLELVFVVDTSGSMRGKQLELARMALLRSLELLQPEDSFQLVRFSDRTSKLGEGPLEATPHNLKRGRRWIKSLKATGGTEMMNGIRAALDFEHDPERLRVVAFFTDGYIGNESDVLRLMTRKLGASRVFSFGIGSSPNRYLLAEMAREGRGAVAFVGLKDDPREAVELYFERVAHPIWTDVTVDWGGLAVRDVFPSRVPDLIAGRPLVLTGRFVGAPDVQSTVRLHARAGGRELAREVPLTVVGPEGAPAALSKIWARKKIADLARAARIGTIEQAEQSRASIRTVALRHGLLSSYTAFIAVDSSARTAGEHGTTVQVPVPVPEGVEYETTVDGGS